MGAQSSRRLRAAAGWGRSGVLPTTQGWLGTLEDEVPGDFSIGPDDATAPAVACGEGERNVNDGRAR
jgi:hypothetical protein